MTDNAHSASADGATALWIVRPGLAELRRAPLGPRPDGALTVEALYGAISRGTEALVFTGQVPESERARMRCPLQEGEFPGPVKYGYMTVGRVVDGPADRLGETVFALHPHQDRFHLPADMAVTVPSAVPADRAILAANMETALNALWDGGALPGMRVVVVGAGVVGALTGALAAMLPGAEITLVDRNADRADLAGRLGCTFAVPGDAPGEADLVIHASASEAGLATALACAGDEATVLELSWYGTRQPAAPLGAAFHARRLTLKSSQVGQVAPAMRPRWPHGRRLAKALDLLADQRFDALITADCRFAELPATLARLAEDPGGALAQRIVYPAAETSPKD
jgi:NADPH:quinone reductase-like Zn-dependent oxidoreductase